MPVVIPSLLLAASSGESGERAEKHKGTPHLGLTRLSPIPIAVMKVAFRVTRPTTTTTSMSLGPGPIVVLGAGVIGLTTAIRILESPALKGREVHVVAGHLPSDDLDANYASGIAGAHHLSFADDNDLRQRRWDMASESRRLTGTDGQRSTPSTRSGGSGARARASCS